MEEELADDDVDTAGGLLAKAIGKVPLLGSVGDIHGLHLVGDRVEGRRKQLATLIVGLTTPDGPAAGSGAAGSSSSASSSSTSTSASSSASSSHDRPDLHGASR